MRIHRGILYASIGFFSLVSEASPSLGPVKFMPLGSTLKTTAAKAIENPGVAYRVQLNGELVQKIRNSIGRPAARIVVTVRQVGAFPEPSCARLAYTFAVAKADGLQLDGPPVFTQEMNICKNGLPPPSTLTPAKIEQLRKIQEREASAAG